MTTIYDVRDFGATADDLTDDSAAIQAAIDAAYEAGGGTVYIPTGLFYVSGDPENSSAGAVEVRSNVTLTGEGMGLTTLKLVDGFDARINGIVRTSAKEDAYNVVISNLTIDGNRDNNAGFQTGIITGVKESSAGRTHSDITISGVEVMNANGYGINPHEITYNLVVENSVSHHNGVDGFVADSIFGGVYRDNIAYENDRHGFNVTTSSTNILLLDNEAYQNGGAGGIVQRGDIFPEGQSDIDWPTNIRFEGGAYYDNGREGIFLKMADAVTIYGVEIHDNQRQGVRVDGASNTTIEASTIYNNSQSGDQDYDEIQIRARDDIYTSSTYYSVVTTIVDNIIYADGDIAARYGIREETSNVAGGDSGTYLLGNLIYGELVGDIQVPGYDTNPQPEPPATDFPPIFIGTTQAETLELTTFKTESISAAEADMVVTSRSKNAEATATGTFVGEDGVYTLGVSYFDENDGEASLGIRINGDLLVNWVADEDFGFSGANSANRVTYEVTVELQQFDEIEVFGQRDGSELVRVDSVSVNPTGNPPPPADNPVIAANDVFNSLEDEILVVGAASGVLSNDTALDGGLAAIAASITTAQGGSVQLQADGSFSYQPLADFFGTDTFEYAAIDSDGDSDTATVQLNIADQPEPPITPFFSVDAGRTQTEDLELATFIIESLSVADEGLAISSRTKSEEASAKGSFIGDAGDYLMSVGYFDESDGASEMGVRINDILVATWIADQSLGSAGASSSNLVEETFSVALSPLDTIEIFGTRDGGELVRIDYFDLEPFVEVV